MCSEVPEPLIIDVRPILEAGGSPLERVDEGIQRLSPRQSLVILASFEPVPLYTRLGLRGFSHRSSRFPDGTWRIEFTRETTAFDGDEDDDAGFEPPSPGPPEL